MSDPVNPDHYRSHPSGIECIQITEHMNFCLGNAFKYIWRAGLKGDAIEDLKKARFYIDREIARLEERRSYESTRAKAEELYANDAGGPLSAADETVQRHYMSKAAG